MEKGMTKLGVECKGHKKNEKPDEKDISKIAGQEVCKHCGRTVHRARE